MICNIRIVFLKTNVEINNDDIFLHQILISVLFDCFQEKADEPDFVQLTWRETLLKFKYPIAVTLLFLLVLIIILCCLLAGGPAPPSSAPVREGKYVEAVTSCGMVEG